MMAIYKYLFGVMLIAGLCFNVSAQSAVVSVADASRKAASVSELLQTVSSSLPKITIDTLPCILHTVAIDNRPVMEWKKGYIILQNKQIKINDVNYPVGDAVKLTGFIQNIFLKSNKKTVVTGKVIQVVML